MSKVLLVNPPSAVGVYKASAVKVAITSAPFVTLATLAGALLDAGHEVRIADLMIEGDPLAAYRRQLQQFAPQYVGITFTTPLFAEAVQLAALAKELVPGVVTMCGGVHASTLPEESLAEGRFDIVALGEGERTIVEICGGREWPAIDGVAFLADGVPTRTKWREFIADLDQLPYPAWQLYDLSYYRSPHVASRKNPVGYFETNRGCKHSCLYCSQNIFGHQVRYKSPERTVEEMFRMIEMGFADLHVKDNNFTADLPRAKRICELLIERRFRAPWALPTGINVYDVDEEFFALAKRAGCYQVAFGLESADEGVLERVNKRQSREVMRAAVMMAHRAGLEILGNFMLGLPGETEATMEESIRFACSLPLTYAKASMTLPFPSSAMYRQLEREGRILSRDWERYNFHTTSAIWKHENLDWETIERYYRQFHRRFYFRPSYLAKRFLWGVRTGHLFHDLKALLESPWAR